MSKILLIGDCHLGMGYPNKYTKWMDVATNYFDNFLLPLIKKEMTSDDIVVQLGDLFDNRSLIPIDVLNYAQSIIEEISKICQVHILVGNHDMFHKSSGEINSINLFNFIPNVFVYNKSTKIEYMGKSILMMPYIEKKSEQIEVLKKYSGCDYLFCHSDLNGAKMHLNSVAHKNNDKIDIESFEGYKNVYSGHIHIVQENKNFNFVGSIHEMDRNDLGNQKGIFILDVIYNSHKFIPNNVSPKHKKVYIKSEDDIDLLENISTKDYWIDLFISNSLLINNRKLRRKLEGMLESGGFSSVDYIDDISNSNNDDLVKESNIENIDLDIIPTIKLEYTDIIKKYIKNNKYDSDDIKNGILYEFNEIIKIYNDEYKGISD